MALGAALRKAREARDLTASEVAAGTNMKMQIVEDLEREDFHRIAAPIYGKGFIKLYAEFVGLDPKPLIDDFSLLISAEKPERATEDATGARLRRRVHAHPIPSAAAAEPPPPPPPPTPPVAHANAGDAAPDLFEAATRRRRQRAIVDEAVSPSQTAGAKRVHASPRGLALVAIWARAAAATCGQGLARLWARARTGCVTLLGRLRTRLAAVHYGDAPLKTITVAVGVVVLLLFVISVMSRCLHRPAAAEENFPVAMDVPEPYFE